MSRGPSSVRNAGFGFDGDDLVLEVAGRESRLNARSWLVSAYCSISSRDRFHFSAINSEPRNCEIS